MSVWAQLLACVAESGEGGKAVEAMLQSVNSLTAAVEAKLNQVPVTIMFDEVNRGMCIFTVADHCVCGISVRVAQSGEDQTDTRWTWTRRR